MKELRFTLRRDRGISRNTKHKHEEQQTNPPWQEETRAQKTQHQKQTHAHACVSQSVYVFIDGPKFMCDDYIYPSTNILIQRLET